MSELVIQGLTAEVDGKQILHGVDLTVRSGEVHAIMGPNGSGKSTLSNVLMGRGDYRVTGGSVTLDGVDLLGLATWERAQAGLFLAMQYPTEVPGVSIQDLLAASFEAGGRDTSTISATLQREAAAVGLEAAFLDRPLNVDFSGGEKKRNETVQMAALAPKFAILDEIDSGLDVDALRQVSRRVEAATRDEGLGVIAITHYNRLLEELHADVVHIFAAGRIHESGGPEVATRLEQSGYAAWTGDDDTESAGATPGMAGDPFGDLFA